MLDDLDVDIAVLLIVAVVIILGAFAEWREGE
jgi:hypothetical protein